MRALVVITVALAMCGCSKELTRSKAKKLIEQNEKFCSVPQLMYSGATVDCAIAAHFVSPFVRELYVGYRADATNQSRSFLESIRLRGWSLGDLNRYGPYGSPKFGSGSVFEVNLTKPIRKSVVSVVGISDPDFGGMFGAPGTVKKVDFQWTLDYSALPSQAYACFVTQKQPPSSGTAIMKQYDDGWRIEHIE